MLKIVINTTEAQIDRFPRTDEGKPLQAIIDEAMKDYPDWISMSILLSNDNPSVRSDDHVTAPTW